MRENVVRRANSQASMSREGSKKGFKNCNSEIVPLGGILIVTLQIMHLMLNIKLLGGLLPFTNTQGTLACK